MPDVEPDKAQNIDLFHNKGTVVHLCSWASKNEKEKEKKARDVKPILTNESHRPTDVNLKRIGRMSSR